MKKLRITSSKEKLNKKSLNASAPVSDKSSSENRSGLPYFISRTDRLASAIGLKSIHILRIAVTSYQAIEAKLGIVKATQHCEQFLRLLQQALPPHFPVTSLPNGDYIIAVDGMMSAFFSKKIDGLASLLGDSDVRFEVSVTCYENGSDNQVKNAEHFTSDSLNDLLSPSSAATTSNTAESSNSIKKDKIKINGGTRA